MINDEESTVDENRVTLIDDGNHNSNLPRVAITNWWWYFILYDLPRGTNGQLVMIFYVLDSWCYGQLATIFYVLWMSRTPTVLLEFMPTNPRKTLYAYEPHRVPMHATVVIRRPTKQINRYPTPFPASAENSLMHGDTTLTWSRPFMTVTVAEPRRGLIALLSVLWNME